MAAKFRELKVIQRIATGGERAWMVEVDTTSPLSLLLPELVQALPIDGEADDYNLEYGGSIEQPVLILTVKSGRHIGKIRDIGLEDD